MVKISEMHPDRKAAIRERLFDTLRSTNRMIKGHEPRYCCQWQLPLPFVSIQHGVQVEPIAAVDVLESAIYFLDDDGHKVYTELVKVAPHWGWDVVEAGDRSAREVPR